MNKKKKIPLIICIDFDDTIVKTNSDFTIKECRIGAKKVINSWHKKGHYIIIWTCRTGDTQLEAEEFLKKEGINYDKINDHSVYTYKDWPNPGRKIYGDVYIDDKSPEHILKGMPSWEDLDSMINSISENKSSKLEECLPTSALILLNEKCTEGTLTSNLGDVVQFHNNADGIIATFSYKKLNEYLPEDVNIWDLLAKDKQFLTDYPTKLTVSHEIIKDAYNSIGIKNSIKLIFDSYNSDEEEQSKIKNFLNKQL
jgi:hypothetical protein